MFKRFLKFHQFLATSSDFEPERYFLGTYLDLKEREIKLHPYKLDPSNKFQQFKLLSVLRSHPQGSQKTILLLGSSESGKTTIINGMINYLLDVQYTADYYRFEMPNELRKSIYPAANNPVKYTESGWFSSYQFQDKDFRFTFIDTPGFHSKHNNLPFGQRLINFLTESNYTQIDAICFAVPEQNCTVSQFETIMLNKICSLFDNNAGGNLSLFTTFGTNGFQNSFSENFSVDNACLYVRSPKAERLWAHTFQNYDRFFKSIVAKPPTKMVRTTMQSNSIEIENAILALDDTIQNLLYQSTNLNREKEKLFELREEINQMNMNNYSFIKQERAVLELSLKVNMIACKQATAQITAHSEVDRFCWHIFDMTIFQPKKSFNHFSGTLRFFSDRFWKMTHFVRSMIIIAQLKMINFLPVTMPENINFNFDKFCFCNKTNLKYSS